MSQSSRIAAFLIIGFIVYVAARGQLGQWNEILFGSVTGGTSFTLPSVNVNLLGGSGSGGIL